jgi:hypothetical protein
VHCYGLNTHNSALSIGHRRNIFSTLHKGLSLIAENEPIETKVCQDSVQGIQITVFCGETKPTEETTMPNEGGAITATTSAESVVGTARMYSPFFLSPPSYRLISFQGPAKIHLVAAEGEALLKPASLAEPRPPEERKKEETTFKNSNGSENPIATSTKGAKHAEPTPTTTAKPEESTVPKSAILTYWMMTGFLIARRVMCWFCFAKDTGIPNAEHRAI